ncbi:MAG: hypothetical protein ACRDXX_07925 [Stackebrandtia sp.]
MRIRTRAALAALPLALLLALTGCNSDEGGDAAKDGGESDAPLSEEEIYEANLKYAECLRDNGLDVEDPKPGEGLQVQVEGEEEQEIADAAMKACEEHAPEGGAPSEEEQEEEREEMLEYAKCMRDNGVEDFADPKPGEGINIDEDVAGDPDFEAAEKACEDALGAEGQRTETEDGQ